jgi:hypothetical protein
MRIINKSIRIIDYENEIVQSRETPESFNDYIDELVSHINSNTSIREYKSRSLATEVINCSLQILEHNDDENYVMERINTIANRLLRKEVEAQGRVTRMDISVQKGSLIQALLHNENDGSYAYLLAKVEHSDFVDDEDFRFKTGFSKDKKTIWKSCIIDLSDAETGQVNAKIYSNTVAKYWCNEFLELDEMVSDELNTTKAFKAIDETLNRNIRGIAPKDYTVIRNSVISYFKRHQHIDYNVMIEEVLGDYEPCDLSIDKVDSLKQKLSVLPTSKNFDCQFNSKPNIINAKIKRTYKVNEGIEIKINDSIENLNDTIVAYEENDGTRFLRIKTNNNEVYQSFKVH